MAKKVLIGIGAVVVLGALVLVLSDRTQFLVGGALVNAGLRMQDHLHSYDLKHDREHLSAQDVWDEFKEQNELSASVRRRFPRSVEHPLVALLVCMDARIDTNELAGDTRRYYYIVRTAGSVLGQREQEMLELAAVNGVKLIVLTRHTDCAAEKAAANPEQRAAYPELVAAVDEREKRVAQFLARPVIAEKIAKGELMVKQLVIDTSEDHLVTTFPTPTATAPAGH